MQLKNKELVPFALISIPLAMGGLPLGLYLTPYYASEMGISLVALYRAATQVCPEKQPGPETGIETCLE